MPTATPKRDKTSYSFAHSGKKLEALCEELRRAHRVDAAALVAELSTHDGVVAASHAIADQLPRVDHRVNCADVAYHGDLLRADADKLRQMIDLNITALTELTRLATLHMRRRQAGTIIIVPSAAGYQPMPHLASYAASMTCVEKFTEAIPEENREDGLRVLAVSPATTDTPMNPGAEKGKRTPEQVVETTWRAIPGRTPSVVDGFANSVLAQLSSRLFPEAVQASCDREDDP